MAQNNEITLKDLVKIEKIQAQIDALCKKYGDKYGTTEDGSFVSVIAECLICTFGDLEELREKAEIV